MQQPLFWTGDKVKLVSNQFAWSDGTGIVLHQYLGGSGESDYDKQEYADDDIVQYCVLLNGAKNQSGIIFDAKELQNA